MILTPPPPAPAPALAWVRKPSFADVQAAYPAQALAEGIGGTGVLACLVQPDHILAACQVAGETPPKTGFGAAALSLVPKMRVQVSRGAGGGAAGVAIPIRFDPPAPPPGQPPLMPKIAFGSAPDRESLAAAAQTSEGERRSGLGVMRCTAMGGLLTACGPAGDDPKGLSRAAVRLAPRFTLATTFADGRSTDGLILNVPVAFGAEPLTSVAGPDWAAEPTPAQVSASFPVAMRARGIAAGRVDLRCRVASDGALDDCAVQKEDPVGQGAAQAAARLASAYRVSVWTRDGRSTVGARVDLAVTLKAPAP